ncbi:MAG: DUF418 domain-containing protein [Pseudomonadota bacterium]
MTDASMTAQPIAARERYEIMDVLRGFALFGVLIANMAELGGQDILATADQLAALPTASLDAATSWMLNLFVFDKANTLFTVLFGIGFWIQLERLSERGAAFGTIYLRRITILTLIGFVHLLGWFGWDILHLYGLMAFILYFSRNLSDRALFWIGLPLLLFGRPLISWALGQFGFVTDLQDQAYSEVAVLARQSAARSGDFIAWVGLMNDMNWLDWFLGGTILGWVAYGLGRFYLGAWIARQGWIQNADDHIQVIKIWTFPILLVGLGLQFGVQSFEDAPGASWAEGSPFLLDVLTGIATPIIAIGYVCVLMIMFHGSATKVLVRPFAPVGQMALTNYLIQSPIIILILTGAGPGLALAGKAGSATFALLSIGVFAVQVIVSHFWMKAFAYGPAEWVWRGLTYRTWPRLRRAS